MLSISSQALRVTAATWTQDAEAQTRACPVIALYVIRR